MSKWHFNWQAEPEGFKKWLFVHLLSEAGVDIISVLSEPTDKFQDVVLTVQANGVELDAEAFFNATERFMENNIKNEVRRLVDNLQPDFSDIESDIHDIQQELRARLRKAAIDRGLDIDWYSDND